MTPLAQSDIEQIVRLVVDRLRGSAVVVPPAAHLPSGATDEAAGQGAGSERSTGDAATLHLSQPVVTLQEVAERLGGVRILEVDSRAVVTPAVRDELRRSGVTLVRRLSDGQRAPSPRAVVAPVADCLVVATSEKWATIKDLARRCQFLELEPAQDYDAVARRLLDVWCGSSRAVWCAHRPYAAVVASGRAASGRLQAVSLHQPAQLKQAMIEAQPNLLIVDDRRWSGYQVARLIQDWCRWGPRSPGRSAR